MPRLSLNITPTEPQTESEPCKGLVFRGYRSQFVQEDGIGERQGIRLLKRKSCPGCKKCIPIQDDAHEFACDLSLTFPEDGIVDGALYSLEYCNPSVDPETGYVDDYDVAVVELGEELQDRRLDWNGKRRVVGKEV